LQPKQVDRITKDENHFLLLRCWLSTTTPLVTDAEMAIAMLLLLLLLTTPGDIRVNVFSEANHRVLFTCKTHSEIAYPQLTVQ